MLMKNNTQEIVAISFAIYLLTVLLTDISLTGFWTDVVFSIPLASFAGLLAFTYKTGNIWETIILRAVSMLCALVVFGLLALHLVDPFARDTLKLRSFYFQSVDGRLFNAYFKPVGSYSGGYGNFWITESPKHFPFIEWRVYWERAVDYDFNDDTFEGESTDNYEVVRNYIKSEVIDKQK